MTRICIRDSDLLALKLKAAIWGGGVDFLLKLCEIKALSSNLRRGRRLCLSWVEIKISPYLKVDSNPFSDGCPADGTLSHLRAAVPACCCMSTWDKRCL